MVLFSRVAGEGTKDRSCPGSLVLVRICPAQLSRPVCGEEQDTVVMVTVQTLSPTAPCVSVKGLEVGAGRGPQKGEVTGWPYFLLMGKPREGG